MAATANAPSGKSGPGGMVDFEALRASEVRTQPYRFLVAKEVLTKVEAEMIRRDYPVIREPGFLTLAKLERSGAFDLLIEDLLSPLLADVLGAKFAVDLTDKPRMITVRRISQPSDGRIHTDSKSKMLTMLTYLNADWYGAAAGCIRVLNGPSDFEDFSAEIPPLAGHVFAFLRADNSWHGHLPFEGERHVVQTTFLTSQDELDRKERRGRLQYWLKRITPLS